MNDKNKIEPLLLSTLQGLQADVKSYLMLYKKANSSIKRTSKQYALILKRLYNVLSDILIGYTIPEWIRNSNCHPDEVPEKVKLFNNPEPHEILKVPVNKLKKHKKDFAKYLWRCYGVEMTWEKGQPKFNIGRKYRFNNRGGLYIIEKRELEQNLTQGETLFQEKLDRYEKLKGLILSSDLRDNVRHLQDVEKAKKYAEEIEAIMKEDKGGLPDYFYKVFNHELRQKYTRPFNSAVEDWRANARLQEALQEIENAYANVMEQQEEGRDIHQEPEPLDHQKERGHLEDFSELPLTKQGAGDSSPVAMNDIQQGETGDCYLLAAAASLAKVAPQLLTGEQGLIQDKGDHLEVKLYLKSSKFEYEYEPVVIEVSKKVLVDSSNQPLNQKLADGELWAIALEKALAQYRGGYDNITAGFAEQGLGMLTGKRAKRWDFKAGGEQGTLDFLKEQLEKGSPITFSTKGQGAAEAPKTIIIQGKEQTLLEKHTYALDKVEGSLIHLYNPHGQQHLQIDFEALEEYFKSVYYTEL